MIEVHLTAKSNWLRWSQISSLYSL